MNIRIGQRTAGVSSLTLYPTDLPILRDVVANTSMWAKARCESILLCGLDEPMHDTLLYPDAPAPPDTSDEHRTTEHHHGSNNPPLTAAGANRVYPNPVLDVLQVMYTVTGKDGAVIQLEDVSGKTLVTRQLTSGQLNSIDVHTLVPGMYLYRIIEGRETMMTGKVAKY